MLHDKIDFRLDGKVALISGAGRGIGAKCAEIMAKAGAKVVVADILQAEGTAVAAGIKASGGNATFERLDVTDESNWQSLIKKTVQDFGGLDVVFNNAGISFTKLVHDVTLEEWNHLMSINSTGVFLGTKHAILAMKPGGVAGKGGSIVNMSSTAGMVSYYAASAYCASKGAVRMLTKVAAVECGKNQYGIRVNSVHPGVIHTPLLDSGFEEQVQRGLMTSIKEGTAMYESMHPIGRLGEPIDVALAVLYLASNASSFVTGSELVVDGGFTAQ